MGLFFGPLGLGHMGRPCSGAPNGRFRSKDLCGVKISGQPAVRIEGWGWSQQLGYSLGLLHRNLVWGHRS